MSATIITPKTKDSIYNRILKSFFKGSKDHLLYRNFALGKDWNKKELHFNYLYLNLLCNFSCDTNYYFNEKLKNVLDLECDTKVNLKEVSQQNDSYCLNIEKTDNLTIVECIIKDLAMGTNDNISKVIYVTEEDLIDFTGSLEEKISAYITAQGIDKAAIDADVWIEYVEED